MDEKDDVAESKKTESTEAPMKKTCCPSLSKCFSGRNRIMIIVFLAILLDNVLLTTIVPIVPKLLEDDLYRESGNTTQHLNETNEEGDEHIRIGIMFAIKPLVQLISNPFIGPITNRIGYSIPMFTGLVILLVSTLVFAFAKNYYLLLTARGIQGLGSACSTVSGMGMLATYFVDEVERGHAFAFALSGLAIGVLIGAPYGGVLFQFISKEAPFLILAGLTAVNGIIQLITLRPKVSRENQKGASLTELLKDPYILVAAGSITVGNLSIAILEPTLPSWMKKTMNSEEWQQGTAFLPASISYLIGANIFGPVSYKIGRGNSAGLGLIINGICLIGLPFSTRVEHLIAPMVGLGFAIGMVDSSMMPLMGHLVDLRHTAVYGSVYAIADVAFCVGFVFGPLLSTAMLKVLGFNWMLWVIAIICFAYAPLTLFLRKQSKRDLPLESV
ncbi:unnamed protein product [Trichobilharzia szidati]|nr:unnamed protein product [Trichobilharzia szidati]